MTTKENQAVLETARDEWNRGNLEGYLQLYAADAVLHGYAGVGPGLANIRQFYEAFFVAFPDAKLTFADTFAAEDRVACRFVVEATHGGVFQGIGPTGKRITIPGITILRFEEAKCVERWSQADFLGLLAQLGAIPAPV